MTHTGGNRPIVPRGRLWKKQRGGIIVRDGRTCQYCGKYPLGGKKDVTLGLAVAIAHCDHVKPLEKGGEDEIWNYVLACERCNKEKGKKFAEGVVIGQRNLVEFYAARKAAFLEGRALPAFQSGREPITPAQLLARGRRHGGRYAPVDEETIERMWRAFQERPSSTYVSEKCQVHHSTARRYIDIGHAGRGIEPFAVRLARIKAEAHRRADEQLIQTTADMLVDVSELFGAMVRKLAIRDPQTGRVVDVAVMPDFRDVVEMGRFRNLLAGGVDKRVGVEHQFAQMSEDELRRFVEDKQRARAEVVEAEVIKALPAPPIAEPKP